MKQQPWMNHVDEYLQQGVEDETAGPLFQDLRQRIDSWDQPYSVEELPHLIEINGAFDSSASAALVVNATPFSTLDGYADYLLSSKVSMISSFNVLDSPHNSLWLSRISSVRTLRICRCR